MHGENKTVKQKNISKLSTTLIYYTSGLRYPRIRVGIFIWPCVKDESLLRDVQNITIAQPTRKLWTFIRFVISYPASDTRRNKGLTVI